MDEIKVILADGTELYFPAGTDDAIIDAKVKEVVSGQSQEPVATERREPIGLGAEAALAATQAGFDYMGGDSPRARKTKEIFDATLRGDQSLSEGLFQGAGQGINYLGEGLFNLLKSGAEAITPDALEDEIVTQLGIFFDQPLMQLGKRALQAGGEEWARFSEENPRAARNIAAVTQVAEVVPARMGQKAISKGISEFDTKKAKQARIDIESGGVPSTRASTAPYRLEAEPTGPVSPVGPEGPLPEPVPTRRAIKNPAQQEAIKQGFDKGTIAMIRETNPSDRANMLKSLKILKEAGENTRYRLVERSTDVVGNSIMKRYELMKNKNKQAGNMIDDYAKKNMADQYVDFSPAVNNFLNGLENIGVKVNDNFKLDFEFSDVSGLPAIEDFLKRVVKRMASPRDITAAEIHSFKRFLDMQVNYGKTEGLSGRAEQIVKDLRRELDGLLDNRFPEYDRLNTTYAETLEAMDEFQEAVGRGIKLDNKYAGSSVGTSLRGVSANTQKRTKLLKSIEDMEALSKKYGKEFDDDLLAQTAFTIDMDRVFGTKADTSLAGVFGEAVGTAPTSPKQFVSATARAAANKLRGVNQEKQFKAMENLLKSFEPSN